MDHVNKTLKRQTSNSSNFLFKNKESFLHSAIRQYRKTGCVQVAISPDKLTIGKLCLHDGKSCADVYLVGELDLLNIFDLFLWLQMVIIWLLKSRKIVDFPSILYGIRYWSIFSNKTIRTSIALEKVVKSFKEDWKADLENECRLIDGNYLVINEYLKEYADQLEPGFWIDKEEEGIIYLSEYFTNFNRPDGWSNEIFITVIEKWLSIFYGYRIKVVGSVLNNML